MPRKKSNSNQDKTGQTSKSRKKSKETEKFTKEIEEKEGFDKSIDDEEQSIELQDEELNIDSITDLDDLEELEEDYDENIDSDFFISEDDLIICPSCGEVIEVERLKLLEECPSCGLHISEFDEVQKYDNIFKEREDEDEW